MLHYRKQQSIQAFVPSKGWAIDWYSDSCFVQYTILFYFFILHHTTIYSHLIRDFIFKGDASMHVGDRFSCLNTYLLKCDQMLWPQAPRRLTWWSALTMWMYKGWMVEHADPARVHFQPGLSAACHPLLSYKHPIKAKKKKKPQNIFIVFIKTNILQSRFTQSGTWANTVHVQQRSISLARHSR